MDTDDQTLCYNCIKKKTLQIMAREEKVIKGIGKMNKTALYEHVVGKKIFCLKHNRADKEGELWRTVDVATLYEISSFGRLRAKKTGHIHKGYVLEENLQFRVVTNEHKQSSIYAKRLVAQAFVPNPFQLPYVFFENDNLKDIRVENLTWGKKRKRSVEDVDMPLWIRRREMRTK